MAPARRHRLSGVDTRALTRASASTACRTRSSPTSPEGQFDLDALVAKAKAWSGLEGLDLAKDASCLQPFVWEEGLWSWETATPSRASPSTRSWSSTTA
jgi:carbamoyl-phosphate synthase small subunit